ncbi:RNA-guided endonuclease InsQ/TnpB family protein [Streptomyces violascens]|uniref:RNA-guided endonuclease InsQ/TnpB family protein n=1 Tax=Streptomyces violascens TaxID=67381 RepID=UPI0037A2456D
MSNGTVVLRAFRYALDPTRGQMAGLNRHVGAARWAFNHALAVKQAAHRRWRAECDALVASGMDEKAARKRVSVKVPGMREIRTHLNRIKGDSRKQTPVPGSHGPHRPLDWGWEVSTYALQCAFEDADKAWKNWLSSVTGQRAGARVGYPRFKAKRGARQAFRICHDINNPTIRPDGYRRLLVPRLGSVRLHDTNKTMTRLINSGRAVVKSVTISRGGHRWYASVLCEVRQEPGITTRAQKTRGRVGMDLGVHALAALSAPLPLSRGAAGTMLVPNPRHANVGRDRLTRAQRAWARTVKGSRRRDRAARRIARVQHQIAQRRATGLHTLTKRIATGFAVVAVENLHVKGMTASARGTRDNPGRKVRQKAGLNRAILDASMGELRRQLAYKTSWYGSRLAVLDRYWPSSKTCSDCGWRNPSLTLADRVFTCTDCGLTMDRDLNAARNIARHAHVASGRGETVNTPMEGAEVPTPARAKGSTRRSGKTRLQRPGHPGGAILRPPEQRAHQPAIQP